jgi:hypothetical protein
VTITQKDIEAADRETRAVRDEIHESREAAFHRGEISYAEIFGSEYIAAPVEAALASWRRAMKIAQRANDEAELGAATEREAA